uniref:GATA-type domain-containing protein n=1 Tax=Strongyloides papillosus TaxID=174720 RepID=A0A0N5BA25_STREA
MSFNNTNDYITSTSNSDASIKSAFKNIPIIEDESSSEKPSVIMKIGSNRSAFTTIYNPQIENNNNTKSMETDENVKEVHETKKQINKPGNIEISKILPPRIYEQGPSDPSSPVDQYKDECKNDSPFLTVDAMQRINLLSPSYAIDINKLCPNYQSNYATSDLGSSTRSSFSISPTTVQLNPLFANFRDSKRSTDYDTDSDYCSKDLLSPYSAFSPSPFTPSDAYSELPETPYSGFVSNDGRSPILSPLPFNSSTLSLHFNFDGQQQRSTSSLSTSRCHEDTSHSQQFFSNFLLPNNLSSISRERSKSEGEMLAESLNAFNESHMMSTLNVPDNQHRHRSKIAASNNIKKEHRIRNCYSPQTHYLEKNFLKPKFDDTIIKSTNIWDTIGNDYLFGNRSSSTPPPTTKESATLEATILAKEAAAFHNASNLLLSSKSALNLNILDKNISQLNFNDTTSTNYWIETQLQAINRAISVNSIPPSTSQHVPSISQTIAPTPQFLTPSMGNYASQLLALSLLQNNSLSISKSHSENDLSNSKKNFQSISQMNVMIDSKQTNTLTKTFPDSPTTTSSSTRLTPTKTSLIPPIGAIPISCGNEAYVCPICGQAFALADRLAKHIASRHKDPNIDPITIEANKIHKCNQCGKKFGRSDMLTRHLRLHTGVKPYSCNVCGQVFSRSDHLSTHQRTHTGEKPYQCPQCNYAASRRDMITRHLRIHSKTEENMSAEMISKINISQSTSNSEKEQLNIKTTLDVPTISLSSPMDTNSINNEEDFKNKAKIIFKSNEES